MRGHTNYKAIKIFHGNINCKHFVKAHFRIVKALTINTTHQNSATWYESLKLTDKLSNDCLLKGHD